METVRIIFYGDRYTTVIKGVEEIVDNLTHLEIDGVFYEKDNIKEWSAEKES